LPTFALVIEYDGTDFAGWQVQPGQARTVQGVLAAALRTVTGEAATLHGAGRTDAGVHAEGQVAHVAVATRLGPDELCRALGALLPRDVAVRRVVTVPDAFHARRDARSKLYRYRLWTGATRSPLRDRTSLWVRGSLDLGALRAAAQHLVGTHDFTSFRAAGSAVPTSTRTLTRVEVVGERGAEVALDFEATGFLRHMVRNLVGTLLEVGRGQRPADSMPALIAARDRAQAGPTAPAQGLTLVSVRYDFPLESEGLAAQRVDAAEPLG
jgi:tRNA pseudouridine38-40 synthase